jgi:hypothetical protein
MDVYEYLEVIYMDREGYTEKRSYLWIGSGLGIGFIAGLDRRTGNVEGMNF